MTLEAALQQQGINPDTVSPTAKAQLKNVLLDKGLEVLQIVLQILLRQNGTALTNTANDAALQAQLQAAQAIAEAEAKVEADKKKRQKVWLFVGIGVAMIAGVVVYIFTKKKR